MGKTSADIQREIEALRREADWITAELQNRARCALSLREQIAERPYVIAGLAVATLAAAFAGYARWRSGHHSLHDQHHFRPLK